jgi:hypothetical protein
MAFPGGHFRSAAPASLRGRTPSTVFPIGRRVFVACTGASLTRVTLTDDSGETPRGSLRDGAEVEIVAWRPHGPRGTRYLVRAASKALEGWLGAAEVRGSKTKPAAAIRPPGKAAR